MQNEIVSVIIDGSIIREDFIEDSTYINITITTLNKNVDFQIKTYIEVVFKVNYPKENIQENHYGVKNVTITQKKKAWETIRCIYIEKGLISIRKNDIFLFMHYMNIMKRK